MEEVRISAKQLLINKANGRIVAVTTAAVFVVVFCVVASYTLIGQLNYQNRVIGAKKEALKRLNNDIDNTQELVTRYKAFVTGSQNILGGSPATDGEHDGDNAKIVLDALPSKYDFPALATSLEKMLSADGVAIQSIGGTDDEVAQANSSSAVPKPIAVPFQLSVAGGYDSIQKVLKSFDRSIRPIQVQTLQITGSENKMTLTITAQTYYQPEKNLNIRTEVVK